MGIQVSIVIVSATRTAICYTIWENFPGSEHFNPYEASKAIIIKNDWPTLDRTDHGPV